MNDINIPELTTLCYMEREGAYLMMHRTKKEKDINKDKWIGVGGHFEYGESPDECLLREVYEETGLTVLHPRLCGIKDWCDGGRRYVVLLYSAERFSGTLRASREGAVSWVSLADLPKLRLADDMQKLLEVFLREELSEFFYRREDGDWAAELK